MGGLPPKQVQGQRRVRPHVPTAARRVARHCGTSCGTMLPRATRPGGGRLGGRGCSDGVVPRDGRKGTAGGSVSIAGGEGVFSREGGVLHADDDRQLGPGGLLRIDEVLWRRVERTRTHRAALPTRTPCGVRNGTVPNGATAEGL